MTNPRSRKITPATAIALVALFVSLGGGAYAVEQGLNADKVDGKSAVGAGATAKRAAGNLVATAKRGKVRGKFRQRFIPKVKAAKVADQAEKAETADDSDLLQGLSAEDLTDSCPQNTVDAGSICYEVTVREAATPLAAAQTCASAGGFLAQASELYGASAAGLITLAAEEWSGSWTFHNNTSKEYITVNSGGMASSLQGTNTQPYRCAYGLRER